MNQIPFRGQLPNIARVSVSKGELPLKGPIHREVRRLGGSQSCPKPTPSWTLSFSLELSEDPVMFQVEFPLYLQENARAAQPGKSEEHRLNTGYSCFPVTEVAGGRGLSNTHCVCPKRHISELPPGLAPCDWSLQLVMSLHW